MSSKPLELSFFCVQPVVLDIEIAKKIYTASPKYSEIRQPNCKNSLWLEYFKKYSNCYDYIVEIEVFHDGVSNLKEELRDKGHKLAPFMNRDKIKSYLLLDSRFNYFIILYEIAIDVSVSQISEWSKEHYDLYNEVRNLMVKSEEDSVVSDWVKEAQTGYSDAIRKYFSALIGTAVNETHISVQNNTGNITCVVRSDLSEDGYVSVLESFRSFNKMGERIGGAEFFKINDIDFSFNGRFHTLMLNGIHKIDEMYKIIPITFHMQYMWFYLKELNAFLNHFINEFHSNVSGFTEFSKIINQVILKIEFLTLHNEHFKAAIEEYNEKVYKKIQSKWNIEESLKNSNRYIGFFKNHLDRVYDQKSLEAEQRQNKILLVIGVLQLFTIVSVWNDYLSSIQIVKSSKENFAVSKFLPLGIESFTEILLPISLMSMIFLLYVWYVKSKS